MCVFRGVVLEYPEHLLTNKYSHQAISNILSPQVAAVFLLGVFWQRTNEKGAFWGLMFGFVLGFVRFGLEFGYFKPPCGSAIPDTRPAFVRHFVDDIHYLHYGALLFLVTGRHVCDV